MQMDGHSEWGYPDDAPLDGLKFLLHFQGEEPRAVFVEQGRVIHNSEVHDTASREGFLAKFRVARNLFFHPRGGTEGPAIDAASVSDALTRARFG